MVKGLGFELMNSFLDCIKRIIMERPEIKQTGSDMNVVRYMGPKGT